MSLLQEENEEDPSFISEFVRWGSFNDMLLEPVKVNEKFIPDTFLKHPSCTKNASLLITDAEENETTFLIRPFVRQHYLTDFSYSQAKLICNFSQQYNWGYLDSEILSEFLHREVCIPRSSTKKVVLNVMPKMLNVLKVVNTQDPRFSSELVISGSYNDKLQVSEPDEFDFLVPLKDFPKIIPPCLPEHLAKSDTVPLVVFPLKAETASPFSWEAEDVSDPLRANEYLVNPIKVMCIFKKYVQTAVQHLELTDNITVCKHYQGTPALTLIVQQGNTKTKVDLVPFVKDPYNYWHLAWPREGSKWPSAEKIEECKMMGVDLVAKNTVFWRYSFSRIENFLLESIDADGGCRKDSLRILKKIQIDHWELQYKKVLASYHLKLTLFWACEKHPNSSSWSDLAMSFRRLVDCLIGHLSKMHLPHYFVDEVNMFRTDNDSKVKLQELCEEVKKLKRNPKYYLSTEA
ncbi:protein mab-21-like 3 [Protopterus annectens]|uniref:protein mab-21-like 3 n=1 Tax=Protopterus annectens TaxID=7888 RepID=UPI001CFAAE99|nr:protein mab-21-like 3 [Protopterus annectens]